MSARISDNAAVSDHIRKSNARSSGHGRASENALNATSLDEAAGVSPMYKDDASNSPECSTNAQMRNNSNSDTTVGLEEALTVAGLGRYQQFLLLLCASTQIADACELMCISFLVLPGLWCGTNWGNNDSAPGLISSSVFVGMGFGAIGTGWLSDSVGRRPAVLWTLALAGGPGLLCITCTELWQMMFLRFLVGLGVGGAPAALALYSEFLPMAARGQKLLVFLLFFSVGSLLEALIGAFTLPVGGWRLLLAVSALPSLSLFVLCYFFLPESVRFNVVHGRVKEAQDTLRKMAGRNGTEGAMDEALHGRTLSIAQSTLSRDGASDGETLLHQSDGSVGYCGLGPPPADDASLSTSFISVKSSQAKLGGSDRCGVRGEVFRPPLGRTTLLLSGAFLGMACAYYGLVLVTPSLFVGVLGGGSDYDRDDYDDGKDCWKSSLPNQSEFLLNALVTAGEVPGLFAAIAAVEQWGRRPTIAFFFVASACCTSVLAFLYIVGSDTLSVHDDGDRKADGAALVAFAVILLFFGRASALAYNQSLWVYTAEAFPTASRTTGLGVTTLAARVGGVLASAVLTPLFIASAPVGLLCCAGCCMTGALIVLHLPRETTGALMDV